MRIEPADPETSLPDVGAPVRAHLGIVGDRCPVSSHNEWDPLEEVIVGRLEHATIPSNHIAVTFNVPRRLARVYRLFAGRRYPRLLVRRAQRQLDELIRILVARGSPSAAPRSMTSARVSAHPTGRPRASARLARAMACW